MARESHSGFDALSGLFGRKLPEREESSKNNSENQPYSKNRSNKSHFNNSKNNNRKPQYSKKNWDNQLQKTLDTELATAPYNFVSLPDKVLPSPFDDERDKALSDNDETVKETFRKYIEDVEKYGEKISGEIRLDIEALTPLFIGGNPLDKKYSFAPIDSKSPILPGSSLRGMFKNIFKIVTCGAMRGRTETQQKGEDFTDEHIYFRCLMAPGGSPKWMQGLKDLYDSRMVDDKDKNRNKKKAKSRPGFLIKAADDGEYYIAPLKDKCSDRSIKFWQYEKDFNKQIKPRDSYVDWHDKNAYCITGKNKNKKVIRYLSLDDINWSRNSWIKFSDDEEVLSSYRNDRNRRGVNLLDIKNKKSGILTRDEVEQKTNKSHPEIETLVPCHFLVKDGLVTAFGHGQYFRIPYKKRISDAIPDEIKDSKIIDFADAVFGRESFWASRVFFEDAKLDNDDEVKTLETAKAHPLMQPNPTSYQLYLEQQPNKELNHWDSDNAKIRGYKMYWHNSFADWKASKYELDEDRKRVQKNQESLIKDLTPLNKGNKFKSKIRFENLNKIELGALLMVFDLNGKGSNAAYKIGQGKPFGFGSIKVKPTLYIENDDAYNEIFDEDGWKNPYSQADIVEYIEKFKEYIKKDINGNNLNDTWQNVMKELNIILNWANTKQNDWGTKVKALENKIEYDRNGDAKIKLNEKYINRVPLKTIFEVVK